MHRLPGIIIAFQTLQRTLNRRKNLNFDLRHHHSQNPEEQNWVELQHEQAYSGWYGYSRFNQEFLEGQG